MAAEPRTEARSLSTINYLAANPPQYPHHPEVKESLILYISKVPGTQDVILSTTRPNRKNVTGEDVANSLYYIHLDTPEELPPSKAPRQSTAFGSTRSSSESTRSAIPRKPLPASAKVLRPESAIAPPLNASSTSAAAPPLQKPEYRPYRPDNGPSPLQDVPTPAATPGDADGYRENPMFHSNKNSRVISGAPTPAPHTSPFPPSTATSQGQRGPSGPPPATPFTQGRPNTPTHLDAQPGAPRITSPSSHPQPQLSASPTKTGRRPASTTFSLTVIRRDPSTGAQVNVGKVSSFATNIPTPERADPSLNPDDMGTAWRAQKIDIHIGTSGYAKYRGMPTRASAEKEAFRPGSPGTIGGQSFTQMVQAGTGSRDRGTSGSHPALVPIEEGFHRQVVMAYGAGWKAGFKKAFHPKQHDRSRSIPGHSPEPPRSPDDPTAPKPFHSRQGSSSTVGSNNSASGEDTGIITEPGPGLRPKGYTFLSPWEGRCEFRTSSSGRSLKLRHVLDSTTKFQLPQFDPREVAQNIQNAQAMGRSRGDELQAAILGTKPVSELRFNLPSQGDFFGARKNDAEKDKRASRLSKQFSHLLHREPKSSDDEYWSEDEELELSLGKEHAGGGKGGKNAKLGKLIVHDEGLKMLDLVVAANVGVWWTTWGRTDQ